VQSLYSLPLDAIRIHSYKLNMCTSFALRRSSYVLAGVIVVRSAVTSEQQVHGWCVEQPCTSVIRFDVISFISM
jgi:hypothetical protein